jgi:hypothetical protein
MQTNQPTVSARYPQTFFLFHHLSQGLNMTFTKGITNVTPAFSRSRKTIAKLGLGMAFVGGLLASASANAGYVLNATIVKVRATEFNAYFVYVDKAIIQPAACATASADKGFVFDPSTAATQCSVWGGVEIVNLIDFQ